MIYLIDDKKNRQEKDFGWSTEKLATVKDYLYPIYTLKELEEKANEVFKQGNTVLYHESFLDGTSLKNEASYKRKLLDDFAHRHLSFNLVLFSGSKTSRKLERNIAHLPASIVYQYLKHFIDKYSLGDKNLGYLVYGKNQEIENELLGLLEDSLANIEQEPAEISNQNNLFVETYNRNVQNAIKGATKSLIVDEENDSELIEFIKANLAKERYDNIFIPLCFGNTLSDYNGLRLATLIRCTETINRLSRIFIYGFVGVEYLFQDKYFNILKTKNIHLTKFRKSEFQRAANTHADLFDKAELPLEIKKLKLDPPKNYDDNHSISNEWAIYKWAKCLDIALNDVLSLVAENVNKNLYFNYLKTVNPDSPTNILGRDQLQIRKNGNPKVLFIDDEAEKGWYEILAYILADLNNIWTDYVGENFKNLSAKKIIETCVKKIEKDDIDIIILDFRLNSDDFIQKNPEEITSVKLLKEIKKINPGIQVIVFSATNKIWNLQVLQEMGVDGFILKKGGIDVHEDINNLTRLVERCNQRAQILKDIHRSFEHLRKLSEYYSSAFQNNCTSNLSVCFELIKKSFEQKKYCNYSYLQLFLIVEEFIKQESIFEEGIEFLVKHRSGDICVAKKNHKKMTTAVKLTDNGKYEIGQSTFNMGEKWRRFDVNFIMSSLLIFRFGNPNSSVHKWTDLYTIRNTKAGHYDKENPNSEISIVDIKNLITFILYITDIKNISDSNISRGLAKRTINDALADIRNDPRVKKLR